MTERESAIGFILQPTYRLERGRPVVHLFGRLEEGGSFLVRDDREVPRFHVAATDADVAARFGAAPLTGSGRCDLRGRPVVDVEVPVPSDAPPLRDRLHRAGVPTYEADVRFAMRYLIDRGIRGAVEIEGPSRSRPGVGRVFDNPRLSAADWTPRLSVLSFDIETDPKAERLLSIALYGCGVAEVLLFTPDGFSSPSGAICVPSERELLTRFAARVREIDPDVITGWHVGGFDFTVLERLAKRLEVPFEIGRAPGRVRVLPAGEARGTVQVSIPGRLVIDGIQLLRGSFVRMESYALDAVAREVLGSGKTLSGSGRGQKILDWFRHDRERLVEYNLVDARLVLEILEKLELVELAVERSRLTGLPPDRFASSVAAFDFLYLTELGRQGVVAPSVGVGGGAESSSGGIAGGHVLRPEPGLYDNVMVFDFKSLYPSLIRTFQIDPLGYARAADDPDPIVSPGGVELRREPGVLPGILDRLMPRREEAKRAGNRVAANAVKILMNSFYGVLGTPSCRFFDSRLASSITEFGRTLLIWTRDEVEGSGLRVLYGDTDSLFVASGESDPQAARARGRELTEWLNRRLADHLSRTWRVQSRLELEFEKLYRRLFLPSVRGGGAGAMKRYAGLVDDAGEAYLEFVGLEVVRRDWTALARRAQRGLYERLFADREVAPFLARVVNDLRESRLDEELIYRKALRKRLEAYTATTPPHVAAARKMKGRVGRTIEYVMTTDGPEPAAERRHPFDYEHYVARQIRPVAEPVLAHLGLEFDRAVGDDRQLGLFG